jgi:hypothetical protein
MPTTEESLALDHYADLNRGKGQATWPRLASELRSAATNSISDALEAIFPMLARTTWLLACRPDAPTDSRAPSTPK